VTPVEQLCSDLDAAVDELKSQGFRIDRIYPADEPHTAVLTRGDEAVRLCSRPDAPQPPDRLPPFRPEFVLTRGGGSAAGRAGMLYRDLVPSRLGGRYIASHISIPGGGPVSDWVHYHRIAVQMIMVRRGWVRVVYEDQGEPFIMHPGDLVLQPPGIRHRVLESSPGLEVVEITAPALHETLADHELSLPNQSVDRDRSFGGQRFLHHVAAADGPIALTEATGGLATARILASASDVPPHDGEVVLGFVLQGSARLDFEGGYDLGPADSFVIPPGNAWTVSDTSADFRLLHVTTARL
jgi:quercetin dioxygenase-like cupin family protein